MRIAVGGIIQESNSFSPVAGSWQHFPPEQLLRGEELLARRSGTRTEVGGAIDVARRHGVELVPLLSAMATASAGPMRGAVFQALLDELLERMRAAGPLDGALLVLHGAMAAEEAEDATGEILRAARTLLGPGFPLVATLDCSAPRLSNHSDAFSCRQQARLRRGLASGEVVAARTTYAARKLWFGGSDAGGCSFARYSWGLR